MLNRLISAAVAAVTLGLSAGVWAASGATAPTWPPAPATTRIEFVRAFSQASDLGISKSFFARLGDFIFGATDSGLKRPMAVVAAGGVIHVADPGARGVHRFDTRDGGYALVTGPDGRPLPSPVGLARGAGGEVYVTDSVLRAVYVIRPGMKEATPLTLRAGLKQPTGIAFDTVKGRLYVADTAAHCILVFDRNGDLLATWGHRGNGDGEFNFPTYLTWTKQGRLYVNDSLNFRIQAFDAEGRFVTGFGRQGDGVGDAVRQKGVAADRYGHLYVADALLHSVQIFDDTGRFLLPVGARGQQPGEFWLPTGIFIDTDDRDTIYIADSFNQRVQVLRYVGGAD